MRLPYYRTGTKNQVLRLMAEYAIRDQVTLIDALTPRHCDPDGDTAEAISHAKACVSDFRKLLASLPSTRT